MQRLLASGVYHLIVVAVWSFMAAAAVKGASTLNQQLDTSTSLQGCESASVETALQQRFGSPFAKTALLLLKGAPSPRTAEGWALLTAVTASIRSVPEVTGVLSYVDRGDSLFIAEDLSSIVVVGLGTTAPAGADWMRRLLRVKDDVLAKYKGVYPQLSLAWTGEAAVGADMRRLSAASTRTAELRVLPLTLLVLLLAFRGFLPAVLPILCGALTLLISMGLLAFLNRVWPVSVIAVGLMSVIGLGLSVDYALLIVSRYRDEIQSGLSHVRAVTAATQRSGHTVLVSGAAIGVGFGAMLLVPVSEIRSIGMAGMLVTATAISVAVTLLPVALSRMGPWINAGRLWRNDNPSSQQRWHRWAKWVSLRPWWVLFAAGMPLVVLSLQAFTFRLDLPRGRWLPESATSVHVLHEIDAVAKGSFGQIIDVILQLPEGTSIQDESGWSAAFRLTRYFAHDTRIQHVWAINTLSVKPLAGPEILAQIPTAARDNFVTRDGRTLLLQLLPKKGLAATDAAAMVREIRAADPGLLTGLDGTKIQVGGVPAFNVDYQDTVKNSLGTIVIIVVCVTLLVLAITFRSVLIPVKAVALNLLTVASSFGATATVFRSEWGSKLLGLSQPLEGGFPIVPILVFSIVFGLSMDYEVFLVARIADGRRAGLGDTDALVEGVGRMGRVITYAAIIMVLIFGAFMFGEFVLIKLLGFALTVAVVIEATLIRLALGPALIQLAGRWNWWPGRKRVAALV